MVAHDLACHYPSAPAPIPKQQIPHQTNQGRRCSYSICEAPPGSPPLPLMCVFFVNKTLIVFQKAQLSVSPQDKLIFQSLGDLRGGGAEFTFLSASLPHVVPGSLFISFQRSQHPLNTYLEENVIERSCYLNQSDWLSAPI